MLISAVISILEDFGSLLMTARTVTANVIDDSMDKKIAENVKMDGPKIRVFACSPLFDFRTIQFHRPSTLSRLDRPF